MGRWGAIVRGVHACRAPRRRRRQERTMVVLRGVRGDMGRYGEIWGGGPPRGAGCGPPEIEGDRTRRGGRQRTCAKLTMASKAKAACRASGRRQRSRTLRDADKGGEGGEEAVAARTRARREGKREGRRGDRRTGAGSAPPARSRGGVGTDRPGAGYGEDVGRRGSELEAWSTPQGARGGGRTGRDRAGGVSTGEDNGGSGAVWTRAAWQAWRGYGADGAGQGRVSHLVGKAECRGQHRAPHQQIAADAAPPLAQL